MYSKVTFIYLLHTFCESSSLCGYV